MVATGLTIWVFIATIGITAPFVLAAALAVPARAIMLFLIKKSKKRIPPKLAAFIAVFAVFAITGTLLALVVIRASEEIIELAAALPQALNGVVAGIQAQLDKFLESVGFVSPELLNAIRTGLSDIGALLAQAVSYLSLSAWRVLVSVPQGIIFAVVLVVSLFFIVSDYEKITGFIKKHLPQSIFDGARRVKADLFSALFAYIKAQFILMCAAFILLFAGFLLLNVRYALLFALIVAVIDALPVFGAGLALIPGAVYFFVLGDTFRAVGFAIMYVCMIVLRQTLEPRLLGKRIGVHPLLTMFAMYAGLKLCGVLGLIIGPAAAVLIRSIFTGYLRGRTLKEIIQ